jgi:hypothetical protein
LEDGIITAEQARTLAVAMNERGIAHRARWISHLENRLTYERAMLGESGGLKADKFDLQPGGQVLRRGHWHVVTKVNRSVGAVRSVTVLGHFAATIAAEDIADYRAPTEGVAENVKAATKLAPMCNYPGEGYRHMTRTDWERRKMSDVPQAIKHKANEKRGAHRTRATSGGGWTAVAVYLTDAKRVDPPAPSAPEPAPVIETMPPEPRCFLERNGVLVALCADGPRQQAELRPLAATWEELPADTFASQGTGVRAVLLTVRR